MPEPLSMTDDNGLLIRFGTTQLGAVGLNVKDGMRSTLLCLSGSKQAEFARLYAQQCQLAGDGQPSAAEAPPSKAEVDRCGWSEDPFHRCRVCYDYAAGRDREHPLTAGGE
jgi:hypothetical protein